MNTVTVTINATDIQSLRPSWTLEACSNWLENNAGSIRVGMEEDAMERISFWLDDEGGQNETSLSDR